MDIESFNSLTYGFYAVASGDSNKKGVYICTVVAQVTAIPPKLMIACNKDNFTAEIIKDTKKFSVSVLKQNCTPTTIGNFGFRTGKDFNKFEQANFIYGEETGCPIILNDSIAWFECQLEGTFDVGTHFLFVGNVLQAKAIDEDETPLTYKYYHEIKKGVTHKNAPSYNK